MPAVLGYWRIRGLAHALRILMKYKGMEFEDKMYEQGDAPEYSREVWTKEKFTLGLDLPNLPYLIDGDLKITETMAIANYLGRKLDMLGSTEEARVRNDMTYSFHLEHRMALVRIAYNPNFEEMKDGFLKSLPGRIEQMSNYLGERKFFAGDELTVCDFCMWDLLDIYRNFSEGCIDKDNLKSFMERFEALPTIKAYMDSDEYMKKPFNNKIAKWGNSA